MFVCVFFFFFFWFWFGPSSPHFSPYFLCLPAPRLICALHLQFGGCTFALFSADRSSKSTLDSLLIDPAWPSCRLDLPRLPTADSLLVFWSLSDNPSAGISIFAIGSSLSIRLPAACFLRFLLPCFTSDLFCIALVMPCLHLLSRSRHTRYSSRISSLVRKATSLSTPLFATAVS